MKFFSEKNSFKSFFFFQSRLVFSVSIWLIVLRCRKKLHLHVRFCCAILWCVLRFLQPVVNPRPLRKTKQIWHYTKESGSFQGSRVSAQIAKRILKSHVEMHPSCFKGNGDQLQFCWKIPRKKWKAIFFLL
jgi:hypothetical protein